VIPTGQDNQILQHKINAIPQYVGISLTAVENLIAYSKGGLHDKILTTKIITRKFYFVAPGTSSELQY